MRGPLDSGVFGDGGSGESKRERRSGHQNELRFVEGKPQFS
jgi:hypothetical protein